MTEKKWMKRAFSKNEGALHRQLGVPEGKPIPPGMLRAAARASGKKGSRARAALNANPQLKKKRKKSAYKGRG